IATWSLEYRRLGDPGGGWPGSQRDVELGVAHAAGLADEWPLDLERVVLAGHCAGGQLALWAARATPLPLRGVAWTLGVVDVHAARERMCGGGVVAHCRGGTSHQAPGRCAAASPRSLLPTGTPQALVHGTDDPSVPFDLSVAYPEAARAAGDQASLV